MNMRRNAFAALTAVALTTACAVAGTPASADPVGTAAESEFRIDTSGHHVRTTIDAGSFAVAADGNSITVSDDSGQPVGQIPLAFQLDNQRYRVQQTISGNGRTLELVPDLANAEHVASPLEEQLAANDSLSTLGTALMLGPLAGAIGGAVIGAVVAVASCAVIAVGCLLAGLPIVGVFAGGGALAGTVLGGGAAAAYAAWNYLNTVMAAPGDSKYSKEGQGTNGAGVPDSRLRIPKLSTGSGGGGSSSGSGKG
ncbi:hypothetical protein [Nocardia cyriacigeorgica]|uniref:hypothetical protein n=1 Tax=Nocardia cyriacigeorgica TaxID=135487 RepID=UPI00031A4CFD|nr:hypothetical protein [Nocardia cyriacigeorgica]MBF6326182.1 hypothetical protein [Nocardia cyriacigeorgica]MBF6499150.1 hypothetical protein [Nocardia cyriacigeorgica]TLF59841.1 hypothetical protein FEK31_05685 [Nocardia cyriacigeorgica]